LRTVFLGTPPFAVPTLLAMLEQHRVECVYTQPDRPKGRGQELAMSAVKIAALEHSLPILQPERIKRPECVAALRELAPDVMVVVGYGQIISQEIIDIPRLGIINVHGSLLPKYRGAAPIQWAIANGESMTGVTTMQINAGLDTGDMLLKAEMPILPEENARELGERMSHVGARLLIETLDAIAAGRLVPQPQSDAEATHAPILTKDDARIDFHWPARKIHDRARGFFPWPGASTRFRGQALRLWKTRPVGEVSSLPPGAIVPSKAGLRVVCGGSTVLEILEAQLEGRKRVTAAELRNGLRITDNEFLGD
jgi:methionyl-tRNA formyltransferase